MGVLRGNFHRKGTIMRDIQRTGAFIATLAFASGAMGQEDVAEGQKLYEAQCASCHTVKPGVNGFGPSLAGVWGPK